MNESMLDRVNALLMVLVCEAVIEKRITVQQAREAALVMEGLLAVYDEAVKLMLSETLNKKETIN